MTIFLAGLFNVFLLSVLGQYVTNKVKYIYIINKYSQLGKLHF